MHQIKQIQDDNDNNNNNERQIINQTWTNAVLWQSLIERQREMTLVKNDKTIIIIRRRMQTLFRVWLSWSLILTVNIWFWWVKMDYSKYPVQCHKLACQLPGLNRIGTSSRGWHNMPR